MTPIDALRIEFGHRFNNLERVLERLGMAVEKLTENSAKVLVVEARFDQIVRSHQHQIDDLRETIKELEDDRKKATEKAGDKAVTTEARFTKLEAAKAVGLLMAGAALSVFVTRLMEKMPW